METEEHYKRLDGFEFPSGHKVSAQLRLLLMEYERRLRASTSSVNKTRVDTEQQLYSLT
jgi:hypothetical protein